MSYFIRNSSFLKKFFFIKTNMARSKFDISLVCNFIWQNNNRVCCVMVLVLVSPGPCPGVNVVYLFVS